MPTFQVNAAWAAMTEVIPNLYICGVSALNPDIVVALDFDLVVNCTKEVPNMKLPPDVDRLKLWLDDTDDSDLTPHFATALDYIKMILEVDGKVLVHCVAGISRSAAICLGYLIKYKSMTLRQAYVHMAKRRQRVRPNLGFWRQLIDFEFEIRGETSVKITRCRDDQELPDVYEIGTDVENQLTLSECTNKLDLKSLIDDKEKQETELRKKMSEERKRQRQVSESENGKRFVPKLEPVIESEQ